MLQVRNAVKAIAERGLLAREGRSLRGRGRAGDAIILAYHNIIPRGEPVFGEASLHLPMDRFCGQLDALQSTHDIVGLTAVSGKPVSDRPRAVITFDDAYDGALRAGIAELVRRGLPATVFVAPGFVPGASFWWDDLSGAEGELEGSVRHHGLEVLAGRDARIREWAGRAEFVSHAPAHARASGMDLLREMAAKPGITFGSHTWSHCNLAKVHGQELEDELRRPKAWLHENFGNVVDWISYPYGLATAEVEEAAKQAGYEGGVRIEGGWRTMGWSAPFAVPRLNVPSGLSRNGFRLRVAGLMR